jgi:two-component sensor histidine kinase/GAF domain-containing protein
MTIVTMIPLLASLLYMVLFVFSWRGKCRVNRLFSAYLLVMGLWSFTSFIWHADFPIIGDPRWLQASVFFGISYVSLMYHLVLTFLGLDTRPIFRVGLWTMYGLLVVILIGDIHGDLIRATRLERGQFDVQFGGLMYPTWVYGSLGVVTCLVLLVWAAIKTTDSRNQRNRLLYLAISSTLSVVGTFVNISPQLRTYSFDHIFNLVGASLMAYAIYRYQLLDLSFVIRRGLAYSVLTVSIATIYLLTIVIFESVARTVLGYGAYLIPILVAGLLAVAFYPLRDRVQIWIDRLFFREKYDAQQMLHRLSRTAVSVLDLNVLTKMLLAELTTTMHIARACLLLKQREGGEFYLAAQRNLGKDVADLKLRKDHPLLRWMAREGGGLIAYQIDILPQFKALWEAEREDLEKLDARLFVPLLVQGDLVGLFAFGPKLSEEGYSPDERIILTTLANQTAVAVENARLYQQAQQELAERVRAEAELKEYRGHLEELVKARTVELEAVNEQLLHEIADRMQAEEELKASLQEKDVLLREIHHRVKNNLQVVSSLLHLQTQKIEDQQILVMFRESENRVKSMALIHERLYRSGNLVRIHFAEYIRDLAYYLLHLYSAASRSISLKMNIDNVSLDLDTAIPCGLIINELLSNALKHAFPPGRAGEIHIGLYPDNGGQLILVVADNGVGFPPDVDIHNTQSLGLQLVNNLVKQLDGTIQFHRNGGTQVEIMFTEPNRSPVKQDLILLGAI